MVLKKSKGRFPGTGNTVRRMPNSRMQARTADRAAIITRRGTYNVVENGNGKDELLDGIAKWNSRDDRTARSLNKKNRWLITEHLEDRLEACKEQRDLKECSDAERQDKRAKNRKSKKLKVQEQTARKTKVIEKNFLADEKQYQTMYESRDDKHSVERGKSWRSQKEEITNDDDCDAVFEIVSGLPSQTWPFNVTSNKHDQIVHYKAGKGRSKNRKRLISDEMFVEDFYEAEEFSEDEQPQNIAGVQPQGTCMLDDFVVRGKTRPRHRKTGHKKEKSTQGKDIWQKEEINANLVYIEQEEYHVKLVLETDAEKDDEEKTGHVESPPARDQSVLQDIPFNGYRKLGVTLNTTSVTETFLRELYREDYFEGQSRPRRFGIYLNPYDSVTEKHRGLRCFIIAEEAKNDGIRNLTELHLKLFGDVEFICELERVIETNGIHAFETIAAEMQKWQPLRLQSETRVASARVPDHLRTFTKWRPDNFSVDEAFNRFIQQIFSGAEAAKHLGGMQRLVEDLEVVAHHCGICFEQFDDATRCEEAIQLEHCLHSFCRDCWRLYLGAKVNEQCQVITCPEYECKNIVDTVTLLSMLDPGIVPLCLKLKFEHCFAKTADWKWCPGCQKPAHCRGYQGYITDSAVCDIPVFKCECHKTWCFECQEAQHWPAKCENKKRYKQLVLNEIGNIFDANGNFYETNVFVKNCPRCKTPIDKNGGCCSMVCRCGQNFCWNCLDMQQRCTPLTCKKVERKSIVFTSVESLAKTAYRNVLRGALQFYQFRKELGRRRVKLGIDRQSTSISKRHPESSKSRMIQTVITNQTELCNVVEHIAITGLLKKSKQYNGRLLQFLGSTKILFNCMIAALEKGHIEEVRMKEVNIAADRIKSQITKFYKKEMHSKDNHMLKM